MASNQLPVRHNRPTNDELHPLVYRAIVGLTIWLLLSIWALFSRGAYVGLNLSMITVFFIVLVGIPILISLAWRHNTDADESHGYEAPFREWISHGFVTWTGRISGRAAATQILLPIAAVAIGMTVFGLAYLFAIPQLGS